MVATRDLYWLAGLLEGEGSFHISHAKPRLWRNERSTRASACLSLSMTDRDVVERAKTLMGLTSKTTVRVRANAMSTKPAYMIQTSGWRAIAWMQTLWPLLGERRRARISQIVKAWRAQAEAARAGHSRRAVGRKRTTTGHFGGGY